MSGQFKPFFAVLFPPFLRGHFIRFFQTGDNPNILLSGIDGSGHLAAGNIIWDAIGNLLISGRFESNKDDNKIIIDPSDRSVQLVDANNMVLGRWYFYSGRDWHTSRLDMKSVDNNGNTTADTRLIPGYLEMETVDYKLEMESARINIVGGSKRFRVSVDETKATLQLALANLPTSKSGLWSGDVWRDGEVIKIVP